MPGTRSAAEEAAFMSELLSGLDDTLFDAVPSPDTTPVKRVATPRKTPSRLRTSHITPVKPRRDEASALLDGAEDWDWDDMLTPKKKTPAKVKQTAGSASRNNVIPFRLCHDHHKPLARMGSDQSSAPYMPEECTRCIVEQLEESEENGRFIKILTVRTENAAYARQPEEDSLPQIPTSSPCIGRKRFKRTGERRTVVLRDEWAWTDLGEGDTLNVLGSFDAGNPRTITITSKSNAIVAHPDLLLTATALSGASQCRRRPLLSALVRQSGTAGGDTPALVWGNMLHEVMQTCMSAGRWDAEYIRAQIEGVVRRGLAALVVLGLGVEAAVRELEARSKGISVFGERYASGAPPRADAVLTDTRAKNGQTAVLAIEALHDVEEDIWSPRWGLKGKLDASVQARIEERVESPFSKAKGDAPQEVASRSSPHPFEIKTGRSVAGMEHRAQTMLYTLLMSERYGEAVDSGLLYYTQSEEVVRVPAGRAEVRALLGVRNELAGWMRKRVGAGRPAKDVVLEGTGEEAEEDAGPREEISFLPETIDDERICKRCFVSDTCMLYRRAVENVDDTSSPIADIYDAKMGHLTPEHGAFFKTWEVLISLEERDIVRFRKELWTMGAREREQRGRCFADMVLDASYVMPEDRKPGQKHISQFAYRFVRAGTGSDDQSLLNGHMSTGDAITLSVEPDLLALGRGFILELTPTEVVVGVDHEVHLERVAARTGAPTDAIVFRVDKDELFGGMGRLRDNLAQLFYAGGDARRRELVVDLRAPLFDEPQNSQEDDSIPGIQSMNPNQRKAMERVLSAQDYALILGMPGTGKTTVIAAIIRELVRRGKTVLLTSYTHSAVDTILLKLLDAEFGILRLGNIDKVHPDTRKFTLAARPEAVSVEQLAQQFMTPPVVATTCLSIDHPVFSRKEFDYCIVDEASQITLPTCLGPLRFAEKFVLVGDHFQLPPLVRNPEARKGGLDVSLFRRLSDAHPHSVVDLAYQYRMNKEIMTLSNALIYSDRLRCASEEVANRSLVLPNLTAMEHIHTSSCGGADCWMTKLLSEHCKAVFVDTDAVPARDSRVGDLVQNETEGSLVYQLAEALLACGIREEQIGVITLYRQQIKLLSHLLRARRGIEILTADRSQGRDKDCIIISMVRSNDSGNVGDLVKDWRRMNVSFTRARSKLIIIGSRSTLQDAPLLAQFFELMNGRGWMLKLPRGAHLLHQPVFLSPSRKRSATTSLPSSENEDTSLPTSPTASKTIKKARIEGALLKGRPFLKDLLNDI